MASQKELFKLIKSLQKSEKQAISLERKKQEKKPKYFILYDWLEGQVEELEEYSREIKSKEIHKDWKESTVRTAETQLYDKIIEILALTQIAKSPSTAINQKVVEADILKNKGFYTRALKHLEKALKDVEDHQKHHLIIDIIPKITDVILLTKYKNRREQVEAYYQKLQKAIHIIQQEAAFRSLNVRLLIQYQESRNPKNINLSIKEDYFAILAKNFPKEGSFFSQYYFYSIQAKWENIHKNYQAAHQHQQMAVKLWLNNSIIRETHGQLYLTQLANASNHAIAAKEFDTADKMLSLMENFSPSNQDELAEKTQNLLFYKQFSLLNQEKFKEARALVSPIEKLLSGTEEEIQQEEEGRKLSKKEKESKKKVFYANRINPVRLYNFYYNTLITLLLCADYEQANKWLVKIHSFYQKKEPRKDINRITRILQLVINYGLNSSEFSQNMFESLYRSKTVRDNMDAFEKALLEFFKKINRELAEPKAHKKHFQQLLKDLEELEEQDKKVVGYYEVYLWVKSQL